MKTIKIMSLLLLTLATMGMQHTCAMDEKVAKEFSPVSKSVLFLIKTVQKGKIINLRKVLNHKDGPKLLNARCGENRTLLHIAVLNEQTPIAEELLKRGIDTKVVDSDGDTALDIAIQWESNEIEEKNAKTMISAIRRTLSEEEKLFFDIKYQKNKDDENANILNLLNRINNGTLDLNRAYYNGWTLAHAAAYANSTEILRMLAKDGANLNAKTNKNRSPQQVALDNESLNSFKYLIVNMPNTITDDEHRKALCGLVKNNKIRAVKKYIGEKNDINIYYNDGTPLHIAIGKGLSQMSKLLIKSNANPNATDKNENNSLHIAIMKKMPVIAILLLSKGVDTRAKNSNNQSVYDLLGIHTMEDAITMHSQSNQDKLLIWASIYAASQSKKEMSDNQIYKKAKEVIKYIKLEKEKKTKK